MTPARRATFLFLVFVAACAAPPPGEPTAPPPPKMIREYLYGKAADRGPLLEELDRYPVPRTQPERVKLLRDSLSHHGVPDVLTEETLGAPPATVLVRTPRDYDPTRSYPTMLGFSAYCTDPHYSLQPFAREELADHEVSDPVVGWEDGITLAPAIPDIAEFDSATYVPVRKRVLDLIAHANKTLAVDPDRVYAAGFSLGSTVGYDVAARYPDRFAGIADVSGGCPRHPTPLTNLAMLGVYVFHGTEDDLVPIKVAHDIDNFCNKFQIPHTLDIVQGGAHAWPQNVRVGDPIRKWLRDRKRDAWPRAVNLVLYPPRDPRHRLYWLELHRSADVGKIAATVADNVITITEWKGVSKVVLHLGEPLVDLEREVVVMAGTRQLFKGVLERRFKTLLEDLETDGWDTTRAAPARLEVELPR